MLRISFILAVVLMAGCSRQPYQSTNKVYRKQARHWADVLRQKPGDVPVDAASAAPWWAGTVNFNLRKPNYVIIHHTAQNSCEQTLRTFTLERTQVSAHYVVCRDGTIHHMLNDYLRAWHGGVSKWGSMTDINSASIGIEIVNPGHFLGYPEFPDRQIEAVIELCRGISLRHGVAPEPSNT